MLGKILKNATIPKPLLANLCLPSESLEWTDSALWLTAVCKTERGTIGFAWRPSREIHLFSVSQDLQSLAMNAYSIPGDWQERKSIQLPRSEEQSLRSSL